MKFYNKDINTIAINALIDCGEISLIGIGSLQCKLLPATIKNGLISPPRQIVEFHSKSRSGANTLSQLISWSYSISLEEADTVYNSWLNNIKSQSDNLTNYSIDGLGVISVSSNNTTIFTTCKEFSLQLNPLTQEFSQDTTTPKTQAIEEPIETSNKPQDTEQTNEPFWKNTSVVFIILFIISTSVAIFFYMKKPKEVIREIKIEKVIKDTIFVEAKAAATDTTNTITNGKYHIIGGVFKSEANATKAAKEFSKNGTTPIIEFIKERNEFFVSVASFNTKEEAQKHLNTLGLANEQTFESHWIYRY